VFDSVTVQLVVLVVAQVALDWIFVIVANAGVARSKTADRKNFVTDRPGANLSATVGPVK
jgi:hypothetical protein